VAMEDYILHTLNKSTKNSCHFVTFSARHRKQIGLVSIGQVKLYEIIVTILKKYLIEKTDLRENIQ
jgi:hypothetical protein